MGVFLPMVRFDFIDIVRLYVVEDDGEVESIGPIDMEYYGPILSGKPVLWTTRPQSRGVEDEVETQTDTPALSRKQLPPLARLPTNKERSGPKADHIEDLPGVRHFKPSRIFNLICNLRPRRSVQHTMQIRDRLSWNSTIMLTQRQFGISEDLCKHVFQQPIHRT